jgi:hypothetical protein
MQNKLRKLVLKHVDLLRDDSCLVESSIRYKEGEIFKVID